MDWETGVQGPGRNALVQFTYHLGNQSGRRTGNAAVSMASVVWNVDRSCVTGPR